MADAHPRLPAAADAFLFALVGEQTNGVGMTVVSALARLGVDPWTEARRLAELPRPLAIARLATMLGRAPGVTWSPDDAQAIAERLAALLPEPRAFGPETTTDAERAAEAGSIAPTRSSAAWLFVLVMVSALLLGLSTRPDLSPGRLLLAGAAAVSAPAPPR